MSTVVGSVATSHSPLLTLGGQLWGEHARNDVTNTQLYDEEGRHVTYAELVERNGDRYADQLGVEAWDALDRRCQIELDGLAAHLAEARPDVLVVVGDDQEELFDGTNQPVLSVFHGEKVHMGHIEQLSTTDLGRQILTGYAMEGEHVFDAHPELALHIIQGLLDNGVDVATSAAEPPGRGFGHAYGFVVQRLLGDAPVPIVPIMLNTYYPPNQPSARRCHEIGVALRTAIEAAPVDLRVSLVASGGLSHFVVDEALDQRVLKAIADADAETLCAIPDHLMKAGSSEIRNWITVAAALADRPLARNAYVPCVRSPAGTGVGMGFLAWR